MEGRYPPGIARTTHGGFLWKSATGNESIMFFFSYSLIFICFYARKSIIIG